MNISDKQQTFESPEDYPSTDFDKACSEVARWSVGVNCAIDRLRRVRDLVQEQLKSAKTHNEPLPVPYGLGQLVQEIETFEALNLRLGKHAP